MKHFFFCWGSPLKCFPFRYIYTQPRLYGFSSIFRSTKFILLWRATITTTTTTMTTTTSRRFCLCIRWKTLFFLLLPLCLLKDTHKKGFYKLSHPLSYYFICCCCCLVIYCEPIFSLRQSFSLFYDFFVAVKSMLIAHKFRNF